MTIFSIKNEQQTENVAARLAQLLKPGDVVALYGTLGAGKTSFCRGLIRSLLPEAEVPSPTFTLLQVYETPLYPIYHFDMYRLKSPDEAYEIGIEDAFAEGVSLIEWPEKIGTLLPKNHIRVDITITETGRQIDIRGIQV